MKRGSFYLVSMPGEVKDQGHTVGNCVTCCGLINSREKDTNSRKKDNSCISPSLDLRP